MKTNTLEIQKSLLYLLLVIFCFSIGSAFVTDDNDKGKKYYVVTSSKNLKIGEKKEQTLRQMFIAMYGKKSIVEKVYVEEIDGDMLLIFLGGGNKTPSVTFTLQQEREGWVIPFENPGINNCKTGSDCTQCKIPCGCGRNGGGGSCISETSNVKTLIGEPLQILMG